MHIGPSTHDEPSYSNSPRGLIIDGRTLVYALEKPLNAKFLKLASHCQVVLCCRATPIQKVRGLIVFEVENDLNLDRIILFIKTSC